MNKSFITNFCAVLIIITGYFVPDYKEQILSVGFFALSGALTNWLAVYMLFEKVPFLYGSGVIPQRFEEFKTAIKHLIMNEFFTDENVDKFFQGQNNSTAANINLKPVLDSIDYDQMFDRLVELILDNALGNILNLVKADVAFEPVRPVFKRKMELLLLDMTKSPKFLKALEDNVLPSHVSHEVSAKIEEIVDQRLDQLTPGMVKDIIQRMIREHLGWLVVWGGVFGGLIGFGMSFIN